MSEIREEHGWAIVSPSGLLLVYSVRPHRAAAIEAVLALFGSNWTWQRLHRGGYRAIRVTVRPRPER